jgi:hypothetical protein
VQKGKDVSDKKRRNPNDTENIKIALKDGCDYISARNN